MDREEAAQSIAALLSDCAAKGHKVLLVGNGGSQAIVGHMAADLTTAGGIRAMCFDSLPFFTCLANDYGFDQVYRRAIAAWADAGDVLIAVSSSGWSSNILQAVREARQRGCRIVALSGFEEFNPLRGLADVEYHLASSDYNVIEPDHAYICHRVTELVAKGKANAANV